MSRGHPTTPLRDRFLRQLSEPNERGCCLWTGKSLKKSGHGRLFVRYLPGRKQVVVSPHRYAYLLRHGSIPDGLFVLHRCDEPLCCTVEHLYLGTHQDNMRDMANRNGNRQRSTSGLPRYVRANKKKFRAEVRYRGEMHYLGQYPTPEMASAIAQEFKSSLTGGMSGVY